MNLGAGGSRGTLPGISAKWSPADAAWIFTNKIASEKEIRAHWAARMIDGEVRGERKENLEIPRAPGAKDTAFQLPAYNAGIMKFDHTHVPPQLLCRQHKCNTAWFWMQYCAACRAYMEQERPPAARADAEATSRAPSTNRADAPFLPPIQLCGACSRGRIAHRSDCGCRN